MNVLSIIASISVTITDIWTKFGTEHKCHTINTPEWSNSQPKNTRCRLPSSWIFRSCEIKKMSVAPDWMKYYMHQILRNNALDISWYNSLPCIRLITACTVVQAVLTVWTIVSCSNNFNTKLGCWATGAPQNDADHVHRTMYYVPWSLNRVTATET